jgi:hypothetical protein
MLLASLPITDLHSSLFKLLSLELFRVYRNAIVSVVDTKVGAFFGCINISCILNFNAFWGYQILSHFSESVFRTGFAVLWNIGSFLYFVMKTVICLWNVKSHFFTLGPCDFCVWMRHLLWNIKMSNNETIFHNGLNYCTWNNSCIIQYCFAQSSFCCHLAGSFETIFTHTAVI